MYTFSTIVQFALQADLTEDTVKYAENEADKGHSDDDRQSRKH